MPLASFGYGRFEGALEVRHSNPSTPFDIVIWKNSTQPINLIHHEMLLKFTGARTTLFVNAITGEVRSDKDGGDFEISCQIGKKEGRGWPWSFSIRTPTGGLAPTTDTYLFQAKGPYEPEVKRDFTAVSARSWSSGIDERMYAKSRGDKIN